MKSFFYTFCLIIVISLINYPAIAQQDTSNQQTVVVTYTKVNYNNNKPDREHNIYNLVKVNPLLVINGDMPIYYERRLNDQVSVEGAIGVTYLNYMYESFVFDNDGQIIEERNAKPGYSAMGSIKLYPSTYTKALEDFYFGFEVRYRAYRSEAMDCSATSLRQFVPEHRNVLDGKITIGYVSYLSDRVIIEFYGGFGMRKRDYARAYCATSVNGFNETAYKTVNDIIPTISAGFKLGFGF